MGWWWRSTPHPESRTLNDFIGDNLQLSTIQQAAGDGSLASGVGDCGNSAITLPAWSVAVLEKLCGDAGGAAGEQQVTPGFTRPAKGP